MSKATKTHRPSGERDSPARPCSNGTVMHGPLFLDDDLLGAADECGLTPRDDADAASCADWLNEQALVAVSFGAATLSGRRGPRH